MICVRGAIRPDPSASHRERRSTSTSRPSPEPESGRLDRFRHVLDVPGGTELALQALHELTTLFDEGDRVGFRQEPRRLVSPDRGLVLGGPRLDCFSQTLTDRQTVRATWRNESRGSRVLERREA